MLVADPATGTSRVLFSEKSGPKSWINLSNSFHAMADGSLIWWSERSGHGHLYHYVDGKFVALTSGPWEVTGLVGVDEAKGRLYFRSEERRVGKACVRTCSVRGWPYH